MNIIKVQNDEQVLQVEKLAKEIWTEYYGKILSKEQIEYMLFRFQSFDTIKGSIADGGYEYYLMYEGETVIGYMGIRPDSDGRLFLSKLYILKAYRGKGYSGRAFDFMSGYCQAKGLHAIWLTCNKKNLLSLNVYNKKGFEKIDEAVADIGHGYVMDDYILEKKI